MYFTHGKDTIFGGIKDMLLQVELCSPKRYAEVLKPKPVNRTLFRDKIFEDVIKFEFITVISI